MLALVVFILIARASVFTVSEGQLAIKSIGGEIVDCEFLAGAAFQDSAGERGHQVRRPHPHRAVSVGALPDARAGAAERSTSTSSGASINLRRYYETTGGSEDVANARLRRDHQATASRAW